MAQKIDLNKLRSDFAELMPMMQSLGWMSEKDVQASASFIRELIDQAAWKTLHGLMIRYENDLELCRSRIAQRQALEEMRRSPEFQRAARGRLDERRCREAQR